MTHPHLSPGDVNYTSTQDQIHSGGTLIQIIWSVNAEHNTQNKTRQ